MIVIEKMVSHLNEMRKKGYATSGISVSNQHHWHLCACACRTEPHRHLTHRHRNLFSALARHPDTCTHTDTFDAIHKVPLYVCVRFVTQFHSPINFFCLHCARRARNETDGKKNKINKEQFIIIIHTFAFNLLLGSIVPCMRACVFTSPLPNEITKRRMIKLQKNHTISVSIMVWHI